MHKQYIIIVAGGVGSRIKSNKPKQFIEIKGVPVIIKTIKAFVDYNPSISIIISVHKNYKVYLENLLEKSELKEIDIKITNGGDTRFDSVKSGLMLVDDPGAVVGIHDAARPFVSQQTIANCFDVAAIKGNAVPCVAINESMRKISNNINNSVNRNEFRIIQTPQCFHAGLIKKAFEQSYSPMFTDDATVLEFTGEKIELVEGNEENIKITTQHDLLLANILS